MARTKRTATGGWHVKVYAPTPRDRRRWLLSWNLKSYAKALAEAFRLARGGQRVRIVDPDGRESGDVIPPEPKDPEPSAQLQLVGGWFP